MDYLLDSPWLTPRAAAAHLGCQRDTIYRYIQKNILRAQRVGGRWLVAEEDVRRLAAPIDAPSALPLLMIVDDDESIGLLLEEVLGRAYRLIRVTSGLAALRHLDQHLPDLLLVDLLMPDMTGLTLCRIVRETYDSLVLPIIVLTALTDPRERRLALELGANAYLHKPFALDELRTMVQGMLQARGKT